MSSNILASLVFLDRVPCCASGQELETCYLTPNKELDQTRALLQEAELVFLRKIDWRCHVDLAERQRVLKCLLQTGDVGRALAMRKRDFDFPVHGWANLSGNVSSALSVLSVPRNEAHFGRGCLQVFICNA